MKIKACLSIGYADAKREEILEINDEDMTGMTPAQKSDYIDDCVQEWADNYIETWWKRRVNMYGIYEPGFKPGDKIIWCDEEYEVVKNYGDSGTVKQDTDIINGFLWCYGGEKAILKEEP